MSETTANPITERFNDHAANAEALARAGREAILKHAEAGKPVAVWRDGQVVWLQPEEVFALYSEKPVA